ncbi:aminotransferase class I/II-fold pyridoxal phosphate-dependent enzyme [Streptomyces collinus]|uniref:aminotransferase class I/II-fold pyridoxal phosphate-dependent enzyme n=1 Tax=Streptomyces collinus TaxID=42684 RepID=UPI0036E88276
MAVDHTRAPVLEALVEYRRSGQLSFTPPGHKQARGADPAVREVLGDAVFLGDVLASGGLDDRLTRGRVLERAERLMADAVHAEHTFFTTCGSSLSVKAAMLAVAGPHEKLLIGRDAHKSVVSGLVLAGIEPVWVEPRWDAERSLAHPPAAADFEAALQAHPQAKGALITSPTPYGACADLRSVADVCHRRGLPLIVDEAWGAHLPFHPALPSWAMDAGADICVTSIHKMGSGLEQGSVFHLQGDLVPPELLKTRSDLLSTTSPSVLIYAGLDGWRRQMALRGPELMGTAIDLATEARSAIEEIDGLHVNDRDDFCGPGRADDFDPLPVIVDVSALDITGYQAADWLRAHRGLDAHLVDHRRISAQITHGDDPDTLAELVGALKALAQAGAGMAHGPRVDVPLPDDLRMEQARLPRDAFFGPAEHVPVHEAVGRVAAEMITPYPPGIPAVLPGERLTEPVLRYLTTGRRAGMNLPDATDPGLDTIRVAASPDA